jgi:hypothetical protein
MGRFEAAKRHEKMEKRGRIRTTGPGERHLLIARGRLCWCWGAGVGCGEGRWGRAREESQGEKQMGGGSDGGKAVLGRSCRGRGGGRGETGRVRAIGPGGDTAAAGKS